MEGRVRSGQDGVCIAVNNAVIPFLIHRIGLAEQLFVCCF